MAEYTVRRLRPVVGVENQNYFPAGPSVGSIEINGNPEYAALSISTSRSGTNALQRQIRVNPRFHSKDEIYAMDPLLFERGFTVAREIGTAKQARIKSQGGILSYY